MMQKELFFICQLFDFKINLSDFMHLNWRKGNIYWLLEILLSIKLF